MEHAEELQREHMLLLLATALGATTQRTAALPLLSREVTSYEVQVTSYKLRGTSYRLQATRYKLQVTRYK